MFCCWWIDDLLAVHYRGCRVQTYRMGIKGVDAIDFKAYMQDRFIDTRSVPGTARLSPSFLITNEMGVSASNPEELTATRWARIVLDIPSAAVRSARLLFYTNRDERTRDVPMRIHVNGHTLEHRQDPESMLTGGWDRTDIPVDFLRNGPNTFVFSGNGLLHADPKPDGTSQRSFDGGRTWHTAALGPDRNLAGEYMVRLRLEGYAPRGVLTSLVMDVADPDPDGKGDIAARRRPDRVALNAEAEIPEGTGISFQLRSGTTPCFDPLYWGPWEKTSGLEFPGRFVQWRAVLTTASAARTPVLASVTLAADNAADVAEEHGVEILAFERPDITYSSYRFSYMPPHPKLTRLQRQFRLDEVIATGETDVDRLALLRDWVHSQWFGWQQEKYPYCPPWDAIEILETTKGNWGFGMCTHYAATFVACAAALGYVARSVIIDHHCLVEVWSDELGKWILEDPGPCREFNATYELDGIPLNALELHETLRQGRSGEVLARKLPQDVAEPMDKDVAKLFVRFGIPLRNDHLVNPEPAEHEHGKEEYHWDGYLWWTDTISPRYPEYSRQSCRPGDFYPTLNRTRIYLKHGERPGTLQVDIETSTPNFEYCLKQTDGGPRERVGRRFDWVLHDGENRLGVCSVNRFGRKGPPSHITVRYSQP